MFYGNGEGLQSVGSGDGATVVERLFTKWFAMINEYVVIANQFLIPLNGSEVSRRKDSFHKMSNG